MKTDRDLLRTILIFTSLVIQIVWIVRQDIGLLLIEILLLWICIFIGEDKKEVIKWKK